MEIKFLIGFFPTLLLIFLVASGLAGLYYYHKRNWKYYPFRDWKYFDKLSAVGPTAAEVMKKYEQMSPILKKGTKLPYSLLNLREWQFLLLILRGLQKKSNTGKKAEAEYKCFQKVTHRMLLSSIKLSWESSKNQSLILNPPIWKLCRQLFPETMLVELLKRETSGVINLSDKDVAEASAQILFTFYQYASLKTRSKGTSDEYKSQMEILRKKFPVKISSTRGIPKAKDLPNVINFTAHPRDPFKSGHRFVFPDSELTNHRALKK